MPPTLPAGEVRVHFTAGSRSTPEFRIHVRQPFHCQLPPVWWLQVHVTPQSGSS
jgi:hypothetical protein